MNERGVLGRGGEDAAAIHLERAGYRILDRNFRCPAGEIDIVARAGRTIVFCEVKTRRSARWGDPSEAVNARKRARLRRLGAMWLAQHRVARAQVRFDVVSVVAANGETHVEHLVDAF